MNIPKPTRVNHKAEEKDKLTEEPFPLAAIVKSSHDAII